LTAVVLTQEELQLQVKEITEVQALVLQILPLVQVVVQLQQDKQSHHHQQLQRQVAQVHLLIHRGEAQLQLVKMFQALIGMQAVEVAEEVQLQLLEQVGMAEVLQVEQILQTQLLTHWLTQAVAVAVLVYIQVAQAAAVVRELL
jgi:hypothetical protein